jgi:hypothetical protein
LILRALLVPLLLLAAAGCVERRLAIRTEPEGAALALDGQELPEAAPTTLEVEHHGTRRVEARKEGYVTGVATVTTHMPWYDTFLIDLFAELWPGTLRSETEVTLTLERRPEEGPPDESIDHLLEEAEAFRDEVLTGDERGGDS